MDENVKLVSSDMLAPIKIEHNVDEIFFEDEMTQNYNFLIYHFEKYGAYMSTRAYLDEIESVALFGPFANKNSTEIIEVPEFKKEVIAYFRRRYFELQTFGKDGYQTIRE